MLRLARQRLGMTQKSAAIHLQIAQPVLSRIENGVAEADNDVLRRAATAYDVPLAFFNVRDTVYGPPVSVHPMARAKADVTARELDMVTAELNIRSMQLGRFLEAVDFAPTIELPSLSPDQHGNGQRIAEIVRSFWNIPRGPIQDLMGIVEKAGVIVQLSDFSGAGISGISWRVPGKPPIVLLNRFHPGDRLRFTLAHELGHIIMHRFPTAGMEDEANDFASGFLIPPKDLKAAIAGRKINLSLLASLKPEWRASMQSLLVAIRKADLAGLNECRYLWQQISAKGWRTQEPPELDIAIEQPAVMREIIEAHINVLGYDLASLASVVPLHAEAFSNYYGPINGERERPRLRIVK